jgi:nicotinate-nucleotide pyrophosphorylase (carboxylating)
MNIPALEDYNDIVERALKEDIGPGDVTTDSLELGDRRGEARIISKEDGIVAGLFVAEAVFRKLDPNVSFEKIVDEGCRVRRGDLLAVARGRASALLSAERVALNFLQRMSGIATFTYIMTRKVEGSKAKIYDTRKTTPGLRALEKYSVRAGGGQNHRIGLYDAVLLKENHVAMAGGVREAVERARAHTRGALRIEVETRSIDEALEAVEARADIIMLDNMSLDDMEKAVALIDGRAVVEVSGNVNTLTAPHIASLGVDMISVGALTHSPDALDISMLFEISDD